ncbi:MAG: hypothetical protein MUF35_04915 [Candidatus Nanopelagicales bacterium]|jgi:hypothetical protein|nr:hypothetical protein [Candidatus Nanopelagicales bacterium]
MDDRGTQPTPNPEPVTPAHAGGTDPATDQAIPPPDDDQLHSDLGLISGGAGEEGAARGHRDG